LGAKMLKRKTKEFKINNLKKKIALWESLTCTCKKDDVMQSHPFKKCEFCRCKIAWDSVPRESFKDNGKTINEITLVRGSFEDVIAWKWENN
tara:strand:+ start:63 stop:338 length:276 start_codon:yes stop_codon:yes gene_type:complete